MSHIAICLHLLLCIFEPQSTAENQVFWLQFLTLQVADWVLGVELILSSYEIFDTVAKVVHMGTKDFMKKNWNRATIFIRLGVFVEIILHFFFSFPRFTRFLRPVIWITRSRELRQLTDTILKTVKQLVHVASLIAFLIGFYALWGNFLFESAPNDRFATFWTSALNLFFLLSLDNYGDLSEDLSGAWPIASRLFLISYLFFGFFLLLPMILAISVEAYKEQQKSVVAGDRLKERKALLQAFVLLDADQTGTIEFEEWLALMKFRLHSVLYLPF